MVVEVQHPTSGIVNLLGVPYNFSNTHASVRPAPPMLGQYTEEVSSQRQTLYVGAATMLI